MDGSYFFNHCKISLNIYRVHYVHAFAAPCTWHFVAWWLSISRNYQPGHSSKDLHVLHLSYIFYVFHNNPSRTRKNQWHSLTNIQIECTTAWHGTAPMDTRLGPSDIPNGFQSYLSQHKEAETCHLQIGIPLAPVRDINLWVCLEALHLHKTQLRSTPQISKA